MSDEDRERWDERYRDGAYEARTHPSDLLAQWLDRLPRGRALDIACGAGRNALFLVAQGYDVTAVDVSVVALERLAGDRHAGRVRTIARDLDQGLPRLDGCFDLIIKMRYLNLDLLPAAIDLLCPGGVLMCEVLLQSREAGVGPVSPRFRAAPGALLAAVQGLEVMHSHEGAVVDPDGRTVHLARLIARKPLPDL